ncbi:MAG: type II toxin-antitoxin system VapB family antitoxin [Actinomycetota bacterium]
MTRTTVIIDDDLLEQAKEITGETKTSRVLNVALESLVRRAKINRLIAMRGSGIIELTNEEIEELAEHE